MGAAMSAATASTTASFWTRATALERIAATPLGVGLSGRSPQESDRAGSLAYYDEWGWGKSTGGEGYDDSFRTTPHRRGRGPGEGLSRAGQDELDLALYPFTPTLKPRR